MSNAGRRLAKAINNSAKTPVTNQRTATVSFVYRSEGTADLDIANDDGTTTTVSQVRYIGATPQVGHQVTYTMNGTEPVILGETGSLHDPVFEGRVVAASFHAVPGENLFGPEQSGYPWEGWTSFGSTTFDPDGTMVLPRTTGAVIVSSPVVPVARRGRHYTGYVSMPDAGGNAAAYVVMNALDAGGAVLFSWGEFVDLTRSPGQEIKRYPAPIANEYLPEEVAALQMTVIVLAASPTGNVSLTEAWIGTSPVMEGGALLTGRTAIDQASFRVDDEDIMGPWTSTVYTNRTWLSGGTWTVRARRFGRIAFITAQGGITSGSTTWTPPGGIAGDLLLPWTPGSSGLLTAHVHGNGWAFPATAHIAAGAPMIRGFSTATGGAVGEFTVNTQNFVTGLSPTGAFPRTVTVSGSYEID